MVIDKKYFKCWWRGMFYGLKHIKNHSFNKRYNKLIKDDQQLHVVLVKMKKTQTLSMHDDRPSPFMVIDEKYFKC